MIATSGFLTALECTNFVFGRIPLREFTALPRLLAGLMDPTCTCKREEKGRQGGIGDKKGREMEREGPLHLRKFLDSPLIYCGLTELSAQIIHVVPL